MEQKLWCEAGNHYRLAVHFRKSTNGKPARNCHDCEIARLEPTAEFPGVDIDAIHHKLGAIRKKGRR
jgi:hypothetical protein